MARSFRTRAGAAALALAGLVVLLAGRAAAEPALWVAKGPGATVYLFGTIHVLRRDAAWEAPDIAAALAASQALWLEIPDPGDAPQAQALTRQLGLDRQHPLSSMLPPPLLAGLDAAARTAGLPAGEKTLEPMRPWLAAVALEDGLLVHAGYDPASGVEPQLLRQATQAGKPVHGFESMAQQLHFLADLPAALQLQMLENTLRDIDRGTREIDALVRAWTRGDQAAIARSMIDEMRKPFPTLYRTLFVARNDAWAQIIAQMTRGTGVTFVAVGAAHLAGPDSLQRALQRRGIAVKRVERTK